MPTSPEPGRQTDLPSAALGPFALITFAITWGLTGIYIVWPEAAARRLGAIGGTHPVFVLAVWGPAIAGVFLVVRSTGFGGLRRFFARFTIWRAPAAWWAFVLAGLPLVFIVGAGIKGTIATTGAFGSDSLDELIGAMAFMLVLGPVEELGWRGVALPLLQRHVAPFWAGLLLGGVWGLWHVPAFLLAGTVQSGWSYGAFFLGNVCLSLIVTPLFNASRGSLLLPFVYHWQLINPLWPDAQPYDTYLLVGVAAIVVGCHRTTLFTRRGAVTEVVPARAAP